MAWCAWLGYYNSMMKKLGLDKEDLVRIAKDYAAAMGMADIPAVPKRTLSKMGLSVCSLSMLLLAFLIMRNTRKL